MRVWYCYELPFDECDGEKFTSRYRLLKGTVFHLLSEVNIHKVSLRSTLNSNSNEGRGLFSPVGQDCSGSIGHPQNKFS